MNCPLHVFFSELKHSWHMTCWLDSLLYCSSTARWSSLCCGLVLLDLHSYDSFSVVGIIEIQSLSKFDVDSRLLSVIIFLFLTHDLFTALMKTPRLLMWKVQAALEGRQVTRTRAFGRKRCLLREQLESAFLKVLVGIRMFCTDQQIIHSARLSLAWRRK